MSGTEKKIYFLILEDKKYKLKRTSLTKALRRAFYKGVDIKKIKSVYTRNNDVVNCIPETYLKNTIDKVYRQCQKEKMTI